MRHNSRSSSGHDELLHPVIALDCKHVSKVFHLYDEVSAWRLVIGKTISNGSEIQALKDISIEVPKGEICGVLGRNGAGKSTLLRTLGGVYSPTSGRITVNGDLTGLFELGGVGNRFLVGREYAHRSLIIQGVSKKEIPSILEEIKEFSELNDYFERPIYTYSSGMEARLYFAIATAVPHDVYLIDEILSVGDEHFQAKCWRRMRNLLSKGASGILVTHDWSAVIKLCKHSYIMDRGEISFSGPSDITVAKYLNLSVPFSEAARFSKIQETYFARTNEDSEFVFEIEVNENVPIFFSFSIELLRLGVGWEIMILSDPKFVTQVRGSTKFSVAIDQLPLAAGEYSMNLFLTGKGGEVFDVKSWTYGNTKKLIVHGNSENSSYTYFPLKVEQTSG